MREPVYQPDEGEELREQPVRLVLIIGALSAFGRKRGASRHLLFL